MDIKQIKEQQEKAILVAIEEYSRVFGEECDICKTEEG